MALGINIFRRNYLSIYRRKNSVTRRKAIFVMYNHYQVKKKDNIDVVIYHYAFEQITNKENFDLLQK